MKVWNYKGEDIIKDRGIAILFDLNCDRKYVYVNNIIYSSEDNGVTDKYDTNDVFNGRNLFIYSNSLVEYVTETSFSFVEDDEEENKERLEGMDEKDEITIFVLYDIIHPYISCMFIKSDGIDSESYSFIKSCKSLYFGWDKINNERIDILIMNESDEFIFDDET